jgi:predicted MFS family arabinose efflux permease
LTRSAARRHHLPQAGPLGRLDLFEDTWRLKAVVVMAAVLGLQSADAGAIGSLAAPIESAFGVGNVAIGLLGTASTLIGVITAIPYGVLVDRGRRVRLLQVVALVWGLATIANGLAPSYWSLVAIRVFQGGATAVVGPALASLAGDIFPPNDRSRLWSYVLTGELVGAGFGIAVTGIVSGFASWRAALSVLGIPALALVGLLGWWLPEPTRGGQERISTERRAVERLGAALEPPSEVEQEAEAMGIGAQPGKVLGGEELSAWQASVWVLRVRSNAALIVASGLGYFFLQGLETFAELYLRERYGVGQAVASLLFVLIASGALVGVVISGRWADRLVHRGTPTGRMVVGAVSFAAITLVFAPATFIPELGPAVAALVVAAACLGAVNPPVDTARLDVIPSFLWGRAEAVRTSLRQTLQGFAPLLFGLVSAAFGAPRSGLGAGVDTSHLGRDAGAGLHYTFLLFCLPMLVAGAVLFAARREYLSDVVTARRSDENRARRRRPAPADQAGR